MGDWTASELSYFPHATQERVVLQRSLSSRKGRVSYHTFPIIPQGRFKIKPFLLFFVTRQVRLSFQGLKSLPAGLEKLFESGF